MLPDLVSNPGPLTYESGALPIALRGPATTVWMIYHLSQHPLSIVRASGYRLLFFSDSLIMIIIFVFIA